MTIAEILKSRADGNYPKFYGDDWGLFQVEPAHRPDWSPAIFCRRLDCDRSYCMTVERWMHERQLGRITRIEG